MAPRVEVYPGRRCCNRLKHTQVRELLWRLQDLRVNLLRRRFLGLDVERAPEAVLRPPVSGFGILPAQPALLKLPVPVPVVTVIFPNRSRN